MSADSERHGGGVDGDVADLERAGRKWTFEAAQDGFDAGYELARAEGLGNIVVGAKFEAEDAIGFAAFGGEENHRHGCEACGLADGAAELQTILARDHDVEHEESGTLAFGVGDDAGAVGIDAHGETVVLQVMANEARNIGIVFDYKDAGFHGLIVAKRVLST